MHHNLSRVRQVLLLLTATVVLTTAPASGQITTTPPEQSDGARRMPYCTNRGARVEQGQLACLNVNGAALLARCGMVLNNPSWEWSQTSCTAKPEGTGNRPQ